MMRKKVHSGIYVVVNPAQKKEDIISQLTKIKDESIAAIQIWDHPEIDFIDRHLLEEIIHLFKDKTPVLINNQWELLKEFALDGVHFDEIPDNFNDIEMELHRDFIKGMTLSNDLTVIEKAKKLDFDYLSFCAMFPSQTSEDCEIVHPEKVKACRTMTDMPIFLAGGITPDNIKKLKDLSFQGIAVVSGIMNAADPVAIFKKYESALKK